MGFVICDDCPPPPFPEPCDGPGVPLRCGGEPDMNGCATPLWCMYVDPYAPCSARSFCPTVCPEDTMPCPKGLDYDGCPMPDDCVWINPDCPTLCPTICADDEMYCPGGYDAKGCPMPDICVFANDPVCQPECPVFCNDDEIRCPGGYYDSYGGHCQNLDICIPAKNGDC